MTDQPELELPTGERVPVTRSLIIGRGSDADLVLSDSEASRRHAEVKVQDGLLLLTDLESRNGTMVNGQRLNGPRALRDGDVLRIGQTQIVFHGPAAAEPAPPPEPEATAAPVDPAATIVAPRMEAPAGPRDTAPSPVQVLGRITRGIAGLDDARQVADTVTSTIRDEYGCEGASLVLIDPAANSLYFASVASDSPSLKLITLKPGEGIVGRAIELNQPALVVDVSKDPGHAAGIDRSLGFTSRSIIAAPVAREDGTVIGALEAINPTRKPAFDADDLEFLVLAATSLGAALGKARDWQDIERERAALARVAGIRAQYVATSPAMVRLVMEAAALHEARTPVYLAGEPGTGRRTLARLVQEAASPSGGLRVVASVAELPRDGVEAVLLPDIEHLSSAEQGDLASWLAGAEGRRPVFLTGGASLLSLLSGGILSPALHERLEAGQLIVPPLRARLDELEPLVDHFASAISTRLGRGTFTFTEEAFDRLRSHPWPGNVAELRDIVQRVGILARESTVDLPGLLVAAPELAEPAQAGPPARLRPLARRRATLLARAMADAAAGDEADRVAAAQALTRVESPEATATLAGLLDDESAPVRAAAAGALAGRKEAAGVLAAHLEGEVDLGVALTLLESLAATGLAAEHQVVARALRAGDARMRRLAMHALRNTPVAREAAEAVRDDPEAPVRVEALAALIEAGEPLEDALIALADEGLATVRAAACEALGELRLATDRLLELTANGDRFVRVAAIRALGHSDSPQARAALLELLSDVTVSAEAAAALGRMGAVEAVPRLIALLDAPEAPVAARRAVVQALARIPGQASTEALARALADAALAETALEASSALAEVPLDLAVVRSRAEQLLRAGSASPEAAVEALEALTLLAGRVADPAITLEAVRALVADPETSGLAVEFLEELGDPAAVPLILAAGDTPEASAALQSFGAGAVAALLGALEGEHQAAAARALAAQGPAVVTGLLGLLNDRRLARAAARAVVEIGQDALPALVSAIEAAPADDLPGLLQVFGQVAPGRLANYVATFLGRPEPAVRYAALAALGNLPDQRSEAALLARVDSAEPAEATLATLALGRIQSADGFEVLAGRVGQGDRRSQYALAGALNEYNLRQAPVLDMVRRMVREGLPVSSSALEAAFAANAISGEDILAAIEASGTPETQKLRLIGAIGRLDSGLAVPPLLVLLRSEVDESLLNAAAAALSRHEFAAHGQIAQLLIEAGNRSAGVRVLAQMQDPRALMAVLREVAPELESDESLRSALRAMGDLILGPLIDVINENWDLESLGLLWQLTEVVGPGNP